VKDEGITQQDMMDEIARAGIAYSEAAMRSGVELGECHIQAAYLCGMAAVTDLLAKHDGSAVVTAGNLFAAIAKVAETSGFAVDRKASSNQKGVK
jgi:hypothetical protein